VPATFVARNVSDVSPGVTSVVSSRPLGSERAHDSSRPGKPLDGPPKERVRVDASISQLVADRRIPAVEAATRAA
jgi:hypothetical protein